MRTSLGRETQLIPCQTNCQVRGIQSWLPDLPKLPVEIKVPSSADKERINISSPCTSKTVAIFEHSGLKYDEIHVNMTKGKGGARFHPTITFRVPNSNDKALWQPTLIDIKDMLEEEGSPNIHVLIMEPRGDMLPNAYWIARNHPLERLWNEKLRRLVLKVLTSIKIAELSVWNFGLTKETAELTVLINVIEDRQKHQWDILAERVLKVCADHGAAYFKVAVVEVSDPGPHGPLFRRLLVVR